MMQLSPVYFHKTMQAYSQTTKGLSAYSLFVHVQGDFIVALTPWCYSVPLILSRGLETQGVAQCVPVLLPAFLAPSPTTFTSKPLVVLQSSSILH